MIVSEKTAEVRELLDGHRGAGRRIAMVGTSGGTHEGHLSLVRRAKRDCDVVAVFWNGALRLEWAPGAVQRYTRDLERDAALLEAAGADLLYVPLRHDLYERPSVTFVEMPAMAAHLAGMPEGATMNILVTMVLTLLNIAGPCTTYFGEKDWQQLVMFQRMAEDLRLPSRVLACPTVREPDGLALSSRNRNLSGEERRQALVLSRALRAVEKQVRGGKQDSVTLLAEALRILQEEPAVQVDYCRIVDPDTLEDVPDVRHGALVAVAARVGTTRLIDNLLV